MTVHREGHLLVKAKSGGKVQRKHPKLGRLVCPDGSGKESRCVDCGCGVNVEMGKMLVRFTWWEFVHANTLTFLRFLKKCEPIIYISSKKKTLKILGNVFS